jgi:hypothetical protein
MIKDPVLANEIVTNAECEGLVSDSTPAEVTLVRTNGNVDQIGNERKLIDAKAKITAPAGTPVGVEPFALAEGEWADDGDQIPEPGAQDAINCFGGATSTLIVK